MMRMLPGIVLALPAVCFAASPHCANWPTDMALIHLKNAGIADPARIDESRTKAVELATEKVGKDRYRQIYDITYHEKSGKEIRVITSSEASSEECSMGRVDVYVVSRKIGGP
ncbi:hypothetical protein [Paraburkholderia sp. JHI869]|uniref:hypothetical protein n=1 Tax=Paraburkholderia sp. JHI869 TaxID=3112959 RepID=UPI003177735E